MNPLSLIMVAGGLFAGSGVLALVLHGAPRQGTFLAVLGAVLGGSLGLWAALSILHSGFSAESVAAWDIPGGALVVGVDPLSAFFLVPLFVVGALCAVYGRGYLGPLPLQAAELNLFISTMILVLLARHALVFLVAWEAMTLLAYLLITFDHSQAEVRRAGWAYLIASHVGVLALFALYLSLSARTDGALDFAAFTDAWRTSPSGTGWLLGLAIIGFGVKAGVAGLHVWLPEAHAAAPSHLSALMSAVLIKLGLYGILRTALFVSPAAWFGVVLMLLGLVGALIGISLALAQRDLKRILAYSSVENVGIILIGLGLGFWAHARGDESLSAIAFAGGLLHIWNHAVMKGLMFLGAGNILHSAGTKDIERLGGLIRTMHWTGPALIIGAVAITGLPPLCGFTSEWLIYRALAELGIEGTTPSNLVAMSAAAVLSLVGGLAALCFVRLIGVVLLGVPRSDRANSAREAPFAMVAPMTILAGACIAGGLFAPRLVSLHTYVLTTLQRTTPTNLTASTRLLSPIAIANVMLLATIALITVLGMRWVGKARHNETWACGYQGSTPRMQYTGRGFSELVSTLVLPRWLRARPTARRAEGTFPTGATFASDVTDPLTLRIYEPLLVRASVLFSRLRILQQGNLHVYILYVFAAVIGGFAWVAFRDGMLW